MVYPDIFCWDNEGDIDAAGFNTNSGLLPTAIKAMIDRVTGKSNPSGMGSGCTAEESTGGNNAGGGGSRPPRPDDTRPPLPDRDDHQPRPDGDDRPPRPERPDGWLPPWMEESAENDQRPTPPWLIDGGDSTRPARPSRP